MYQRHTQQALWELGIPHKQTTQLLNELSRLAAEKAAELVATGAKASALLLDLTSQDSIEQAAKAAGQVDDQTQQVVVATQQAHSENLAVDLRRVVSQSVQSVKSSTT